MPTLQDLAYPTITFGREDLAEAHHKHIGQVLQAYGHAVYCLQRFEMFMAINANESSHDDVITRVARNTDLIDLHGKTMGQLRLILINRRSELSDLEEDLRRVLKLRNFLTHDYFRERSQVFALHSGRDRMLHELREAVAFLETIFAKLLSLIYEAQGRITVFRNIREISEAGTPYWLGAGDDVVAFGQPLPGLGPQQDPSSS